MTTGALILQYIIPTLIVSSVVLFLIFCLCSKKSERSYSFSDDSSLTPEIYTVTLPEDQLEDGHYDRFPPLYSTLDLPPSYAQFDPKLMSEPPESPPPDYDVPYSDTSPLTDFEWTTDSSSYSLSTRL
ncbi:uncharacterized protein V6R79_004582 [Siganus canaliculatus]